MLKPLDIVILLAAHLEGLRDAAWTFASLAVRLGVSPSQVHTGLKRAEAARLWHARDRRAMELLLVDFAAHGIPHVFPPRVGPPARGIATASSWEALDRQLSPGPGYVWPHSGGTRIERTLEPLDRRVPTMVREDAGLHEALAMIDALRVGRTRERMLARDILKARLLGPPVESQVWLAAEPLP
jgi:hypothetical protein